MPASVTEFIAQLSFSVQSLEVRYRTGEVRPGDLENLKATIDDARLRLWALLQAPEGDDSIAYEERFRIRRARELCGRLARDLEAHKITARQPEFGELVETNRTLSRALDAVAAS